MIKPNDVVVALYEKSKDDTEFRIALKSLFSSGKYASEGGLSVAQSGLHLLNHLSRLPEQDEVLGEEELWEELVSLAFDRDDLRSELLPLLTQHNPRS
jgi:hypothetical protein